MRTRKTFKTHPFYLTVLIPKGHPMGLKNGELIKSLRFLTELKRDEEVLSFLKCGCQILKKGEGKI